MSRYVDLTGVVFDRLTVVHFDCIKNKKVRWICRCVCGNEKSVVAHALKSGHVKSCGCLAKENMSKVSTTHGLSRTPEYRTWITMKERCYVVTNDSYDDYGGRGITVYDGWLNDFPAFLSYIGKKPSKLHTLDRINTNGNYEPNNIRWATKEIQNNNKRSNVYITHNNTTKSLSQWALIIKISKSYLSVSIKKGRTMDEIVRHIKYKKDNNIKSMRWKASD